MWEAQAAAYQKTPRTSEGYEGGEEGKGAPGVEETPLHRHPLHWSCNLHVSQCTCHGAIFIEYVCTSARGEAYTRACMCMHVMSAVGRGKVVYVACA